MKNNKLAAGPRDGVGHEIIPAGLMVLEVSAARFGFSLQCGFFDSGAGRYLKDASMAIVSAMEVVFERGVKTTDLGGKSKTDDFLQKIIEALKAWQ